MNIRSWLFVAPPSTGKARGEIYAISKYYEVRSDEDFTSSELFLVKTSRAASKLKHQKQPISKSILALGTDLNKLAVRNFKSLLQWCGDYHAQFKEVRRCAVRIQFLTRSD